MSESGLVAMVTEGSADPIMTGNESQLIPTYGQVNKDMGKSGLVLLL